MDSLWCKRIASDSRLHTSGKTEQESKESKQRAKQQPLIKKVGLIEIYSHFESPETQSGYNGIAMLKVRPGIDTCHCFVYNFSTANRFKSDWKLIEFS